jgi:hypothetical protein
MVFTNYCIGDTVRVTSLRQFSLVMVFLLVSLCFSAGTASNVSWLAHASPTLPVGDAEYSNGTLTIPNSSLTIGYDWINVSGTQILNYAICTVRGYPYNVPIANILGQHFRLEDGSEVFVASALDQMEVYRDLNGDGIPQANFTAGDSEILYYMYSNMSDNYNLEPLQRVLYGNVPHYQWSFTYENVHAYFQNASVRVGVVARLIFDHLTISYDFSMSGNSSNLKTNFDIGQVSSLEILDSSQFSLDGLSLALLYATVIYTSKSYATFVNGVPYNSTTAETSAVNAKIAQVAVDNTKAYDFVFGGNYTLRRGLNNETYPTSIETYEAKAAAVATSSLPIPVYGPVIRGLSFFRTALNLTDLFGGSWPDVNSSYNASSLMYRLCFPVWDGLQIVHDPLYVGYVFGNSEIGAVPSSTTLPSPSPSPSPSPTPSPSPSPTPTTQPTVEPTQSASPTTPPNGTDPNLIIGIVTAAVVAITIVGLAAYSKKHWKKKAAN